PRPTNWRPVHSGTRGAADAVHEGFADASNPDVEVQLGQAGLKVSWVPVDLDDVELTAVAQRAPCSRHATDKTHVLEGRTSAIFVDERNPPVRTQTFPDKRPELFERCRWDVRQPEAEEHGVIDPIRCPGEHVALDI